MRRLLLFLPVFFASLAAAKIHTETVTYKEGDTVLEGYVAYDDKTKAKRPAVIVVHDWLGVGDYSKRRTRELAGLGYLAFSADIYGKNARPKNTDEAKERATELKGNRALMRKRAMTALAWVKAHKLALPKKIAAIGYCFGGTTALEMARGGADLAGVVSFHGGLDTPNPRETKNVQPKLLVLHGADDPFVAPKEVEAFQQEMRNAGADWQFIAYSGAVHAFTIPEAGRDNSRGAAYNEKADHRSWDAMKAFFKEVF